ncbi:endonuclease domain-containing protein [Devosia enhydra]|nr:DUF559 domain-containing protein [Devosia enhydra]
MPPSHRDTESALSPADGTREPDPLTPTLSPEGRGGADTKVPLRKKRAPNPQTQRARALRSWMTDAEARLWFHLRNRRLGGWKFVRQLPIGPYFADFACRDAMLVVEADGSHHDAERDERRDAAIAAAGYRIVRLYNRDILANTPTVLDHILGAAGSIVPSPRRGEGQGEGSSGAVQSQSVEPHP